MPTLANYSQQYRALNSEWQAAPKATVNLGVVNVNGNAGAQVALTMPTNEQLGRVVSATGEVQQAGAPLLVLVVRATDPNTPVVVRVQSFDNDANTEILYQTPDSDGLLEVYDIQPTDLVQVRAAGAGATTCSAGWRVPQLNAY